MKTIEDEIKHLKEHTSYKEKRRQMAEDQINYKLCDEITEEISAISKECRPLELELKELTKKDDRSKGYYSKKKSLSSTSSDNSAVSPQPPSESETESANDSHDTVVLSDDDDPILEGDESFHGGLPAVGNQGGQSAN